MANRNRPNIPKFGEWKNGEASAPYTIVFDKARMKKTDPNFNPNDPSQFHALAEEKPAAPKPNATPPRQMKGGAGERREERRYPPSTPPQVRHQREDDLVPQFGAWNDPNSGGGQDITGQFRRVEQQRNRDKNPGAAPPTYNNQNYQNHSPYGNGRSSHKHHRCVIL